MSVVVIAEAACTWRGVSDEVGTLKQLADEVKAAGAEALKIQWCSDGAAMGRRRGLSDTYPLLQFDPEFLKIFHDLCVDRDLEPMCTVFLPEDVAVVAPWVTRYKVSSLESRSVSLRLAYHGVPRKPCYVSTGCLTESETEACLRFWRALDGELLHCVTAYPAPLAAQHLASAQPYCTGFSDHTGSLIAGAVAVGAGLTVMEKHVRPESCDPKNPDWTHSLTPRQFREYVANVREAEQLYGEEEKTIQPCEWPLQTHRVLI